jgi:hypothetical protein
LNSVKKPLAQLHYSLYVNCPHCDELMDLSEKDPDYIIVYALFNNCWDDLNGYDTVCPKCGTDFQIEKVIY